MKNMLCKHTRMPSHTLSFIPPSHLHTCATRIAITHAPSPSRVLHCSTFPQLEPERRGFIRPASPPPHHTHTQNAKIRTAINTYTQTHAQQPAGKQIRARKHTQSRTTHRQIRSLGYARTNTTACVCVWKMWEEKSQKACR